MKTAKLRWRFIDFWENCNLVIRLNRARGSAKDEDGQDER